ncbi:MAG: CoA-binding protein [SAR324 cluster bacterium]|nr:CoA-binding protein [SAR324 cluster bacterium]MBL7034584.1 CoA-binding protein [SAR324 cluster bacterium]
MGSSRQFDHSSYSDSYIREILRNVHSIAMVGASTTWNRPSNFAMKYLLQKGFRVIPVNPGAAGKKICGETVFADLTALPTPVDMVDIFRPAEEAPGLVEEAIKIGAKVFWMQLEISHSAAASRAEDAGMKVVMDRCPKIEYARLTGELGWNGINTGVISNRRKRI